MKLMIDGTPWKAHFHHQPAMMPNLPWQAETYCSLHPKECTLKVRPCKDAKVVGIACCSKKDQFIRRKGRKLAFAAAVSKLADRSLRRKLWAAYLAIEGVD